MNLNNSKTKDKIGFWWRQLGQNDILRYGYFSGYWRVLWDIIAKLGQIDFTIGLHINIDVNDEQNKLEVHISKNEALAWPFF